VAEEYESGTMPNSLAVSASVGTLSGWSAAGRLQEVHRPRSPTGFRATSSLEQVEARRQHGPRTGHREALSGLTESPWIRTR
jgi:hypothetical protein